MMNDKSDLAEIEDTITDILAIAHRQWTYITSIELNPEPYAKLANSRHTTNRETESFNFVTAYGKIKVTQRFYRP